MLAFGFAITVRQYSRRLWWQVSMPFACTACDILLLVKSIDSFNNQAASFLNLTFTCELSQAGAYC